MDVSIWGTRVEGTRVDFIPAVAAVERQEKPAGTADDTPDKRLSELWAQSVALRAQCMVVRMAAMEARAMSRNLRLQRQRLDF